jgi:hypothetical protein
MEEKIKCRTEGLQLMLKESLEKLSKNENLSVAFKEYFLIEESYSSLINKSQLDKQIKKQQFISLLNEYYYKSSDEDMILLRRKFEKNIKNIFYSFIITPSFIPLIEKIFGDEGESKFDINKNSIMKGVHASFYDLTIKNIRNSLSLSAVPNFILYYDKKIINSKINDIIVYKYNFNYENKERKSLEYKYLENLFKSFTKEFKPLIDINLFSLEFRISFFKLLIASNHKFINKNQIYNNKFIEKFERYILIFKLKEKQKELLNEYNNDINKSFDIIESELNNLITKIKNDLFKKDENNKNNVIIVHDDNNQELKSLNKKYLKLIFALSMMYNNIISIIKKNNKEGKEEISYKINNKIKCSSIERQFLLNILNIFKEEKSFVYNYLLETYIYEETTNKYNRHLYHKLREKDRVIIPYTSIINGMIDKHNENKDNTPKGVDNKNNNKINENKNKNKNEEQQKFINQFSIFYNTYKIIFEQKEFKKGFFGSIFNKKIPIYLDSKEGKVVNYGIYNLKLIPIINRKISSSQISIIIDGSIYDSIIFDSDEKRLSHKEIFNTFFSNNLYLNSDFYCYDWQSLNYKRKDDFKEVYIFYGKLLAYIIISKLFFQYQTINLIGQSTGCKIIKHCLIELQQLKNKLNIYDLINNIILIGGATHINIDKYPNIFDNITGKIVNIFSTKDHPLFQYKKTSVGLNELKAKKEYNDKYNIINIDLSKKYIKQEEYIFELPKIFINDLNIN